MMGSLETAICFMSFANVGLLVMIVITKSSEIEWKQNSQRKAYIIEAYEKEVRDLKGKNEKLNEFVNMLRTTDE